MDLDLIQTIYLPLHVFSVIMFGGVVFGCFFQICLMILSNKHLLYRDMAVTIAILLLGIPFAISGIVTGFLMATKMMLLQTSWVMNGLYALTISVFFASMGAGLYFIFMVKKNIKSVGFGAAVCYFIAWLLWLFGVIQMIGKGTL